MDAGHEGGTRSGPDRDRMSARAGGARGGISRRGFLRSALVSAAAPLGCGERRYATDAALPNVLFLTADDLGWKDVGCYGSRDVRTPHIDRLAREGVRFTRAFGATSSCSSARATFITGQFPHTHGVTGLAHRHPLHQLRPFRDTLPSLLRDAGYHTAIEGKWHVAPYLPTSWYGYEERLSGIFADDMWIRDASSSRAFVRESRGHRFYFEVNYMNNHRDAEGDFHFAAGHPIDPARLGVPAYLHLPDWPEIRAELARYASQTEAMDAMIGALLDALDETGQAANTLVVFVSDNGAPFPGSKMTLYDRGIGTPLLLRWPERLPAGRVVDELVSTVDLMPTFLEAARLPVPAWVEGESLLSLAAGAPARTSREAVFAEMTHHIDAIPARAVRTRRWKYIRNYSDNPIGLDQLADEAWAHRLCELPDQPWKRPRPREELYDLAADPDEQRNLAADPAHAGRLRTLSERLDAHMQRTADPYLGRPFAHDYDPERFAAPAGLEIGGEERS
jgi:N-sulfoglucosamine sulfohydrolase